MADKAIGKVNHYYDKAGVAVVQLNKGASLKKGDEINIKGHTTDFNQKVGSMQIDHKTVDAVKAGDDFGLKVDQPAREGDQLLTEK